MYIGNRSRISYHFPPHVRVTPPLISPAPTSNSRSLPPLTSGAVDADVLGVDAFLERAHFRMVSSASEQTGRFDPKIADFLLVPVHDGPSVFIDNPLVLLLDRFLLLLRLVLTNFRLLGRKGREKQMRAMKVW